MWLVYVNRTEDNILLRQNLDGWPKEHLEQFEVSCVMGEAKNKNESTVQDLGPKES